jgi:zinc D-Ala-D-Ala carboxypeptidase
MPTVNSPQNSNHNNKSGQFIPVKVVDVVLDMNFPDIEKIGGWDALGTVLYIKVSDIVNDPEIEYNRNNKTLISSNNLARPLFSNTKYYPLKGEIVLIFSTTGRDIIKDKTETYYFPNINIWNHPHHNALPNPDTYNGTYPKNNNDKTKNDYVKSSGGLVRQVQDGDSEIPLGSYFEEQLNTKPLLPFEGDHIIEGRYGNSIRFGATAPGPNDWSTAGKIGDPITIIRNGQSDELDNKGWEPTTEDVNRDPSSIYLTSTQKLDKFVPASLNWQSWGAKPTVVEDPLEALSSPVIEEYTESEPPTSEEDIISALKPETAEEIKKEEEIIEAEDNVAPAPEPEENEEEQDELSFYDELIESGDYDEEDFEVIETETITGAPIGIDFPAEISATDSAVLVKIGETQTSSYRTDGILNTEMLIGKHFKLSQLIHSNTAKSKGWSNIPGQDAVNKPKWTEEYIIRNLENLMINVGDYIYEAYPNMQITSGYRAKKLNDSLGSNDVSHHPQGCAIDIQVPGTNTSTVTNWIIDNIPAYAQVIWEKPESAGSWVHIAYKEGENNKKTDVYTSKENILAHYGNSRRGGGKTKYMNIDRAKQNLV